MVKTRLEGAQLFRDRMRIFVNRIEEGFDTGLHEHDFCDLNYVSEGSGYQHFGDQVLPAAKGDFFALPVGSSHVFRPYSSAKNRRLVVYNVVFQPSLLEEIAASVPDLSLHNVWHSLSEGALEGGIVRDSRRSLEPLFERIYEEHAAHRIGEQGMLTSLLTQILIEWVRLLRSEAALPESAPGLEVIGEAVAYVRERATDPLTLRETARFFRISERHFHRLFKGRTGLTFHEFVQKERIRSACELLRTTYQKLDAVAAAVGYRDTQSFCRIFRRIEGKTPGQYRKDFRRSPDQK